MYSSKNYISKRYFRSNIYYYKKFRPLQCVAPVFLPPGSKNGRQVSSIKQETVNDALSYTTATMVSVSYTKANG